MRQVKGQLHNGQIVLSPHFFLYIRCLILASKLFLRRTYFLSMQNQLLWLEINKLKLLKSNLYSCPCFWKKELPHSCLMGNEGGYWCILILYLSLILNKLSEPHFDLIMWHSFGWLRQYVPSEMTCLSKTKK